MAWATLSSYQQYPTTTTMATTPPTKTIVLLLLLLCVCVCVITPKCNKRAVRCGAEKAHHSDNNKLHFSYKERKRLKIIHTFFFFFFFFFPCSPYSLLGRLLHFERGGAHPAAAAASSRQQGNYFLGGRYTNREDK